MKPKYLKKLLLSEIKAVAEKSDDFCIDSSRNFSRKRKLSFETVVKTIIGMESKRRWLIAQILEKHWL